LPIILNAQLPSVHQLFLSHFLRWEWCYNGILLTNYTNY
jgi:hypothetical protein